MKNLSDEEKIIKAYELSQQESDVSPNTSLANYRFFMLLIFLILGITVAFLFFRFFVKTLNPDQNDKNSMNPLFFISDDDDMDTPESVGVKVYDVRKDRSEIDKNTASYKKRFQSNLKQLESSESGLEEAEMIRKKDNFAAEKLELLQKIDQAKTREERAMFIKELENKTGGRH